MEEVLSTMIWKSPMDFIEATRLDIERGKITLSDLSGHITHVRIIRRGDKLRAWCEECKSYDCIHAYLGIDLGIREIVKRYLEIQEGSYHRALMRIKRMRKREIKEILEYLGIDVKDLNKYINRIGRRNSLDIKTWEDVIGRPKRFYL